MNGRLSGMGPWASAALLLIGVVSVPIDPAAADTRVIEREVTFENLRLVRSSTGPWMELEMPGAEWALSVGEPAVPSRRLRLRLPAGYHAAAVQWEVLESEQVSLPLPLVPYCAAPSFEEPTPPVAEPDPSIYGADDHFPSTPAEVVATIELSTGTRFGIVRVNPARVRPLSGALELVRRARVRLVLERGAGTSAGQLQRIRPALATPVEALATSRGQGTVLLSEPGWQPGSDPTVEGSPVEYLIIVPPDESFVEAWQRLADWKTQCGHPALIVTTAEIDEAVTAGADLPEKIRAYIRDAYLHWGLRWVLLGADVDLLPTRFALSWGINNYGLGTEVSSDYYYACLDGSWDADEDGVFGEADYRTNPGGGDYVDFTSEVQVGRVSAKTAQQVDDYLDKYFVYVQSPPTDGSLDRLLLLGEVLFPVVWERTGNGGQMDCDAEPCDSDHCRYEGPTLVCAQDGNDGAIDCWAIEDILNEHGYAGTIDFLVERAEWWRTHPEEPHPQAVVENLENVLSYLNDGTSMVMQSGHADRDRWAIGDGRLLISDLGLLNNGDHGGHYFWAHTTNCKSAAIEYDSFGEQMLLLPDHGAVGYVGTTHVNWPTKARPFNADFFHFAYQEHGTTIGDGLFGSLNAQAIADTTNDGLHQQRFLLFTYIVLGDPGMMVWQATPERLNVAFDTGQTVGAGTLTVLVETVSGDPVPAARVCARAAGVYVVGLTGENGIVELPFWPRSTGSFEITATAAGCMPQSGQGSIGLPTSGEALVLMEFTPFEDGLASSSGNGNGLIEVGERVGVRLTVRNDGPEHATQVRGRLLPSADAPQGLFSMPTTSAEFGAILAGEVETIDEAFVIDVVPDPPAAAFELDGRSVDQVCVSFELTLISDLMTTELIIPLNIGRPRIDVAVNEWTVPPGETTASVKFGVINRGKATASFLGGKVIAEEHVESVSPVAVSIPSLAPGDTAQVGPFHLTYPAGTAGMARVQFQVMNAAVTPAVILHSRSVDLSGPAGPESLLVEGHAADDMILRWKPAVDAGGDEIAGYKVLRKRGEDGRWQDVYVDILRDHNYMQDFGLDARTLYQYGVRAVDAGGNLGSVSEIVAEHTRAPVLGGWPQELKFAGYGSPLICELDGVTSPWGGRNMRELVFCGERIYAFHGDGTEVVDGDHNDLTTGPFSELTGEDDEFWGKPAVGDLDGDGDPEVVAISFKNKTISCWSRFGGAPRWSYSFPATAAWNSPTLADLDLDGTLEVIFCGGSSWHEGIYVLDHNGDAFRGGNPLLFDLEERFLYQPPSVGYIDYDAYPDIVILSRFGGPSYSGGALHVIEGATGTEIEGFEGGIKFNSLGGSSNRGKSSPALANADGVGGDEIFALTADRLWCFEYVEDLQGHGAYNLRWYNEFEEEFDYDLEPEPVLGELYEESAGPEVVVVEMHGRIWVWDAVTGDEIPGFPIVIGPGGGTKFGTPILANVDDDPRPDIIVADSEKAIHAITMDGVAASGFPLAFSGLPQYQSLAAWDVDDDGYQNLVAQAKSNMSLSIWDLTGVEFDPADNPWPMRFRDSANTGRYTPFDAVAVAVALEEARVDAGGTVWLSWRCSEPVAAFTILRHDPGGAEATLIGEVPGVNLPGSQQYQFSDQPGAAGSYTYELHVERLDGGRQLAARTVILVPESGAVRFGLHRVAPRPIVSGRPAAITFGIPGSPGVPTAVRLRVLDLQGRLVHCLSEQPLEPGTYSLTWDGRDAGGRMLPSGLYLLRLEGLGRVASRRVLLMR